MSNSLEASVQSIRESSPEVSIIALILGQVLYVLSFPRDSGAPDNK